MVEHKIVDKTAKNELVCKTLSLKQSLNEKYCNNEEYWGEHIDCLSSIFLEACSNTFPTNQENQEQKE
jgi:hypothetical protein